MRVEVRWREDGVCERWTARIEIPTAHWWVVVMMPRGSAPRTIVAIGREARGSGSRLTGERGGSFVPLACQ